VVSKDDDAWRAIVDNYGDRPELGTDGTDPPADPPAEPARPEGEPESVGSWDDAYPDSDWSTDRFVPPPPPPLPTPTTDRLLAWLGVFGSPAVLLVCLVFGIDLPRLIAYFLVGAFIGGFLYLVAQMPRGPRDPNDDGAQV
jgi:hypothetical protein